MLKYAQEKNLKKMLKFCEDKPLGVRIASQLLNYGFNYDFCQYWIEIVDGNVVCIVSVYEMSITVCANEKFNAEQTRIFIQMRDFTSLEAEEKILKMMRYENYKVKQMLKFSGETVNKPGVKMANYFDHKKVFDMMSQNIDDSFEASHNAFCYWLSDFGFKRKNNMARACVNMKKGVFYASAITSAESQTQALITGVVCSPDFRGQGFGKEIVQSIVYWIVKDKKQAFLVALNDDVEKFYHKIGFENYRLIGIVSGVEHPEFFDFE